MAAMSCECVCMHLRETRDLSVSGRSTLLVWLQRRFGCEYCGHRSSEQHLAADYATRRWRRDPLPGDSSSRAG